MNTRFLETYVMLADLESFRATARVLHVTPATISLRIKSLEDELKCKLVYRTARSFRLTPEGMSLLGLAKTVVEATAALRQAAGQETTIVGRLRLGVIETVVHSWLAGYITQLNATYPKLEVDLTVDSSAVLQKRLLGGALDLAIRVGEIDDTKVVSSSLAIYPVRWIARRGLLSRSKKGLALRVLQRPVLTFGRGTGPQVALESMIANLANDHGLPPGATRLTCSPSVAAIVQLARDGYGVAAIPSLFVVDDLKSGELVELPLEPFPPPIVVSLCRRVDATLMVHAAANVARIACTDYCNTVGKRLIEACE